jgi:hypothetical protein
MLNQENDDLSNSRDFFLTVQDPKTYYGTKKVDREVVSLG